MVDIAAIHTIHRITKILLSCLAYYNIIYTLNLTSAGPYPGKKIKLFEYAKGLPPDVAECDSNGRQYLHPRK